MMTINLNNQLVNNYKGKNMANEVGNLVIKITRDCYLKGKIVKEGEVITLAKNDSALWDLVGANKAVQATEAEIKAAAKK